jgi:hypothetical protein
MTEAGFTQQRTGGGGANQTTWSMKTIIEMHADFSKVEDRLQTLLPLMQKIVGTGATDQARAFGAQIRQLEKSFERLKTKALDFRDAIKGAFSDSADLIGGIGGALEKFKTDQAQFLEDQAAFEREQAGIVLPPTAPVAPVPVDIAGLLKAQAQQAQQLAKLLKELQTKGLNVANLTELAGQGAGAIPIAQALLDNPELIQQLNNAQQQIADITQQTADKMTQAAFGDKLVAMSHSLDTLLERLNHFLDGLRPEKINDKNQEFVDALDHLIQAVNNAAGRMNNAGGGGNNNGNGGGGTDDRLVGTQVRNELLALKRRNLTTGL